MSRCPIRWLPSGALPQFVHTASVRVQEAYRYSVANPVELENYPCYCGCGNMGHTSNRSCYIKDIDAAGNVTFDDHAAGCGICVDITQDVMRLRQQGKSVGADTRLHRRDSTAVRPGTNAAAVRIDDMRRLNVRFALVVGLAAAFVAVWLLPLPAAAEPTVRSFQIDAHQFGSRRGGSKSTKGMS